MRDSQTPSPGRGQDASRRPIARLVACLAILLLGLVAARGLNLAYLPTWSLPELVVSLRLPQASEIDDVTRRWIQDVESAIRAVGDVTGTAGHVDTGGGSIRVRFQAGTDAERKAGRLESELAALRRELPRGARLDVSPAGQGSGELAVAVWIEESGGRLERSLVEAVRALPQVRDAWVAGEARRELRILPSAGTDAAALERAVDERLAVRRLGEVDAGGRRLPLDVRHDRGRSFGELWVRHGRAVVPLAALAELELFEADSRQTVRLGGRRGPVLLIDRELGASPLALERELRRTLDHFALEGRYRFLLNEAEPLRQLVERLLLGLAAALAVTSLLAFVLGGWKAAVATALALPVALAAALNAFTLAGLSLDVTTLPMLAVALGWCLFLPVFRAGRGAVTTAVVMLLGGVALAVAAALAGGRLAPLLQAPMRAFLCAQLGGALALWVLPLPRSPGRWLGARRPLGLPASAVGAPLRAALRNPWTVLLATLTLTYLLLVLFGSALEPRQGDLRPSDADLRVELGFAEGTTPEQAEAQIARVEAELDRHDEIREHWSLFDERWGRTIATVRPDARSPVRLRRLAGRLQVKLNALGASARVTAMGSRGGRSSRPVRFTDSIEDEAETDKEATFYRFVLRSTDLEVLRTAHTRIMDLLVQIMHLDVGHVRSDWGRPAPRVELVPRPGTAPADRDRAAAVLLRRASLAPLRQLPSAGDLGLRVVDPHGPREDDEVRQRDDLLGLQGALQFSPPHQPVVPGAVFEAREVLASPYVKRQAGRYVLPVTVRIPGSGAVRPDRHLGIDRALRRFVLPATCDMELPEMNPYVLGPERRRMVAIVAALVALLLVLATCRLSSLPAGALTLVPLLVAVAATAPWARATRGRIEEMALFAVAAAMVASLPLAIHVVAAARERCAAAVRDDYRWLVEHSLGFAVATLGMVLLLAVPGLGLDGDRAPWVPALRLAAVTGFFSALTSYLCLGALLRAAVHWRERGERRTRRRAVVEAWRAPGVLELASRRMTKVYGNGFKALRRVDFHLEPGIIGLLGPNGAGKTTLLRILCGLLEPSRGEVLYRGRPVTAETLPEYRRLVGFLPQEFNAYEGFTGERFLDYWALEKGIRDPRERRREVERWFVQMGLEAAAGRKVRDYSGGMRRRIGIARALLGDPPIVIVDEPTTGLDVASRNRLRESLLQVAGERVILFSTHIASDVAAAAARILLLDQGRLLYDGPAKGLVERARGVVFETEIDDSELREFSHRFRVTTRVRTLDGVRVRAVVPGDEEPPGRIVEPNLEEAYLAVVSRQGGPRRGERERLGASILDLESWKKVA